MECAADIVIIGGGIAGINTALFLCKKYKVLLLDDRPYWGGRINTKKQPQYEMGAARFNNNHKYLMKLIKKYDLEKIELPKNIDYLDKKENNIIKNVNQLLDFYFSELIKESKKYSSSFLKQITLFEFMNKCNVPEMSERIVSMFGYFSEIKKMNAYDALDSFKGDFVNTKYYVLKQGLSLLCEKMIKTIQSKGGTCLNDSFVTNVKKEDDIFCVETKDKKYKCRKVIFSIKGCQLKQFKLLKPVHKYCNYVHNSELFRIYAKYPVRKSGPWFANLRRTTTNSFLRQIIPINYEIGLIMISYTDGKDVSAYKDKNGKLLKENKIKDKIQKELHLLFDTKIPEPTYFKLHYWTVGAHHWKPGADSATISKKILTPMKNIFICGEAFSTKQAWIEGALETSHQIINKL